MKLNQYRSVVSALLVVLLFATACIPATPELPALTEPVAPTSGPTNTAISQPTQTSEPPATAEPTLTPAPSETTLPTLTPTAAATATQLPPAYDNREFPIALLASYVDALNRQDYARAYGYWENPPAPSLEAFMQGFTDTVATDLIVSPPARLEGAAGSIYASIPTVLVATHTDHSQHVFYGCYVARRNNVDPQNNLWSLNQAQVTATAESEIMLLLTQACRPGPQTGQPYDNATTPEDLVASYYDAINRQDFQRAYGYWEIPPLSFDDFVSGFADTQSVQVAVLPPARIGAAAGSQYADLATFLLSKHTNGQEQRFAGCFTTRRPNNPSEENWKFYTATLQETGATNPLDVATALKQACPAR